MVIADIDADGGEKAAEAIKAQGGRAQFIQTDVGDAGQAQRLVDQTLAAFGRLDVLINNAGIIKTAEFLEISEADFDAVLRVNLKRRVPGRPGGGVARQGKGAIVMSSANAVVAIPNQVPYVTSKGAVNQLTKVMALALADKGVRVNAIGPGSILTDLLKVVMNDDAARQRFCRARPWAVAASRRKWPRWPCFSRDDASYLTGQCIYPDGGRLALATRCRCRPEGPHHLSPANPAQAALSWSWADRTWGARDLPGRGALSAVPQRRPLLRVRVLARSHRRHRFARLPCAGGLPICALTP